MDGPQGPQGPPGSCQCGPQAEKEVVVNILGAQINEDCSIQIDLELDTIYYKEAIVQVEDRFLGLHCIEAPEVWFFDVMQVFLTDFNEQHEIDPDFLAVCEPGSVCVISVATEEPVAVGSKVHGDVLVARTLCGRSWATVTLAGIRKGAKDRRFPKHTPQQKQNNDYFWAQALKGDGLDG